MKQNFDQSLEMLLHHEGGYVWHPEDPGGETNLGVTRAVYEQWVGRQVMDGEMKRLTVSDVAPIYKKNYWDRIRGDDLPSGLDFAAFDWAVNSISHTHTSIATARSSQHTHLHGSSSGSQSFSQHLPSTTLFLNTFAIFFYEKEGGWSSESENARPTPTPKTHPPQSLPDK